MKELRAEALSWPSAVVHPSVAPLELTPVVEVVRTLHIYKGGSLEPYRDTGTFTLLSMSKESLLKGKTV